MNILLDTCVWKGAAMDLKNLGHNVIWVGSMAQDPGDRAIIEKAFVEKRIIVTIDKDFGELAVLYNFPHYGIIRLVDCPARKQGRLCVKILDQYKEELFQGAIITAEPTRIRIRFRQEPE